MFDPVVSVELDDWYLQLMPESDTTLNIGFVKPDHEPLRRPHLAGGNLWVSC